MKQIESLFFERVSPEPMSGCWIWARGGEASGYGMVRVFGTMMRAHRASYEIFVGQIPAGYEIDHKCRNRACVNPDHLEAVTRQENQRRGYSVGGINFRKTQCKHGHPFDAANTRILPNGDRQCIICSRATHNRSERRRRARLNAGAST